MWILPHTNSAINDGNGGYSSKIATKFTELYHSRGTLFHSTSLWIKYTVSKNIM